jgi:fucose 4-O-acetylase-like acetyltransferase
MGKRIEYIDAMRGVAILLVVTGHVIFFSFHNSFENVQMMRLWQILNAGLEVPIFFFISGFFSYKPVEPRGDKIMNFIGQKFKALVIPATAFMLFFCWLHRINLIQAVIDPYKAGFWFTFSLFEIMLLYLGMNYVAKLLRIKKSIDIFIVVYGCFFTCMGLIIGKYFQTSAISGAFNLTHLTYFIYFILGALSKKHFKKVSPLSPPLLTIAILLYFTLSIYSFGGNEVIWIGPSLGAYMIFLNVCGLIILLAAFQRYSSWSTSSPIGRFLQYIGRYTLDIYFIQYFALPSNLFMVGNFFNENPNPTIEYILAVAIATITIILSLLIGKLMRLSPFIAHWFLGVKTERPSIQETTNK